MGTKAWPVCALEIGLSRITALVGNLHEDGSIAIIGKGEYSLVGPAERQVSDDAPLEEVLGNAEESAETSIHTVHLVMGCENITRLIPQGSIPVLTSIEDSKIEEQRTILNGIRCNVTDVVFSGYCSALAVTTPEQKGKGVIVLDVGGEMVTYAAFAQGQLVGVDAFKILGKVEQIDSEAIRNIHKAVQDTGILNSVADGIFLTGEGAQAHELSNMVATTFGMKCSIGLPIGFKGLAAALNKPEYAACLGMLRYAYTDGLTKVIRPSWFVAVMKRIFGR